MGRVDLERSGVPYSLGMPHHIETCFVELQLMRVVRLGLGKIVKVIK
jgi:hypothetical protein